MKDLIVKVSVLDTGIVTALVHSLAKYKDELPKELLDKLTEISECEIFEYDARYFYEKGMSPCSVIADGITIEKSVSINPILKRVSVIGSPCVYFEECSIITSKGEVIPVGDL